MLLRSRCHSDWSSPESAEISVVCTSAELLATFIQRVQFACSRRLHPRDPVMSRSGGCGVGTGSPRASREPEACVSPAAGAAEVGLSVRGQGFPLGAVRYGSEEEAGCQEAMNQPVIRFHAQELCFLIQGDRHMKGTLRGVVASLGQKFQVVVLSHPAYC